LQEAFDKHSDASVSGSWMVGDRATDMMAGDSFKLQTAWLGSPVLDDERLLNEISLVPSYRGKDLRDFVSFIKTQPSFSF
jgi:histidinol phosphatase-like enzyme